AGEAGARTGVLDVDRGGSLGNRHELLARQQDLGDGPVVEVQGARDESVLILVEQALPAGLLDQTRDLVVGERGRDLVLRLDADRPNRAVGDRVQGDHERLEDRDHREHEGPEDQRRAVRGGQGVALWHHLAVAYV